MSLKEAVDSCCTAKGMAQLPTMMSRACTWLLVVGVVGVVLVLVDAAAGAPACPEGPSCCSASENSACSNMAQACVSNQCLRCVL